MIYQFDRGEIFWRRCKLSPQYAPTKPAEKYIEGRAGLGVKNFLPCQIGISFFLRTNNLQVLPFLTNQLFGFGLIRALARAPENNSSTQQLAQSRETKHIYNVFFTACKSSKQKKSYSKNSETGQGTIR